MSKADDIRKEFEARLLEGLQQYPLLNKGGEPILDEEGRGMVVPPPAPFMAVARAYLKDKQEAQPASTGIPIQGTPSKLLEDLQKRGKALPFAPTTDTQQ